MMETPDRFRHGFTLCQFTTEQARSFRLLVDDAIQGLPGFFGAQP